VYSVTVKRARARARVCVCVCVCVCVRERKRERFNNAVNDRNYIVLVTYECSIGEMLVSEEDQHTWTKTISATFSTTYITWGWPEFELRPLQ
jgi:hypothetical protein